MSISKTATLYKAGTTTGLDQTSGLTKETLTATTNDEREKIKTAVTEWAKSYVDTYKGNKKTLSNLAQAEIKLKADFYSGYGVGSLNDARTTVSATDFASLFAEGGELWGALTEDITKVTNAYLEGKHTKDSIAENMDFHSTVTSVINKLENDNIDVTEEKRKLEKPTTKESEMKLAKGLETNLQDSLNLMPQYPEFTPLELKKKIAKQKAEEKKALKFENWIKTADESDLMKRYEKLSERIALQKALRKNDPSELNPPQLKLYNELQLIINKIGGTTPSPTTPSTTTSGGTTGGGTTTGGTTPIVKADPVTRINQNIKNTSSIAIRKWTNTLPLNEAEEIERKARNGEPIKRDGKQVIWTGKDPNLDSSWEIVE